LRILGAASAFVSPSEKSSVFLFFLFSCFFFFALYPLKQLALTREHKIFIRLMKYCLLTSLPVDISPRVDFFIDSQEVRAADISTMQCATKRMIGIEFALCVSSLNYARI